MAEIFMGRHVERNSPARIGKKISLLVGEGTPQKQAVAEALSMDRAHRLTANGDYIRAKKGRYGKSQMD